MNPQQQLPMEDPLVSAIVEFHVAKFRRYRLGKVKRALGQGVYEVAEVIVFQDRFVASGRAYLVPLNHIRRPA